jgi:hypothetical protein
MASESDAVWAGFDAVSPGSSCSGKFFSSNDPSVEETEVRDRTSLMEVVGTAKRRKAYPKTRKTARMPIEGGTRNYVHYPIALTKHVEYHTSAPNNEAPHITPQIAGFLSHVARLILSGQNTYYRAVEVLYKRNDAEFNEEVYGFTEVVRTTSELTELAHSMSTETIKKLAHAERNIPLNILALSTRDAIAARLRAEGMSPRRAIGEANRRMQERLQYANARSLRNLLQPGARRGISPEKGQMLSEMWREEGQPIEQGKPPVLRTGIVSAFLNRLEAHCAEVAAQKYFDHFVSTTFSAIFSKLDKEAR